MLPIRPGPPSSSLRISNSNPSSIASAPAHAHAPAHHLDPVSALSHFRFCFRSILLRRPWHRAGFWLIRFRESLADSPISISISISLAANPHPPTSPRLIQVTPFAGAQIDLPLQRRSPTRLNQLGSLIEATVTTPLSAAGTKDAAAKGKEEAQQARLPHETLCDQTNSLPRGISSSLYRYRRRCQLLFAPPITPRRRPCPTSAPLAQPHMLCQPS